MDTRVDGDAVGVRTGGAVPHPTRLTDIKMSETDLIIFYRPFGDNGGLTTYYLHKPPHIHPPGGVIGKFRAKYVPIAALW